MVQYIITPWRCHAELLNVRQQLYTKHDNVAEASIRRDAVAKVMVWVQRGNCPHLVESTAILISAILNDMPGNSMYCVRAAYAAAFCRFVTGLLDSHQDKKRKLSMYSIAKTIGLPATYVELRHQATHEELPSLPKLRVATQKALSWIWDYYWMHVTSEQSHTVQGTQSCKDLILEIVYENNDKQKAELEARLYTWGQDELLDALLEVQSTESDVSIILRCMQLQQKILAYEHEVVKAVSRSSTSGNCSVERHQGANINHLRRAEDGSAPKMCRKVDAENCTVEGWQMWTEVWVSKPIGTSS